MRKNYDFGVQSPIRFTFAMRGTLKDALLTCSLNLDASWIHKWFRLGGWMTLQKWKCSIC